MPHPILICTYTNVAVDNLVEGFVNAGLKALRIGPVGRTKESLTPYTYQAQIEKHPLNAEIEVQNQVVRNANIAMSGILKQRSKKDGSAGGIMSLNPEERRNYREL